MGLRVWARIQGPSDGGRREKGGGSGGGGERRRRRGWRRAASSYRGRRRRVGGFPCARGGVRGAEGGAHVAGRLGSRGGFFPTRGFCLRRFGGQAQTGPARPTQAPHHANKRADRFQVKQVYIMQFLQSNEQNYQALKQTGNKIAACANFDA